MRVTNIELYTTDDVQVLAFGLRATSYTDKFLAKATIGLDAEEIVPNFYGFGAVSGARYYDFNLPPREVVLRIVLNPNFALNERYSDIRDELYRAISSSRTGQLKMVFKSGPSQVASLTGQIVKFEVPLNSKVPELQLTMIFDDPMLRGVTHVELTSADVTKGLNEIQITDAISTAPHGVVINTTLNAVRSQWRIYAPNLDWEFKVIYPFVAGDVIHMSSEYGNPYLHVVKFVGGTTVSLMDKIAAGSMWPIIFPKLNEWMWENAASYSSKNISYRPAYWGV